MSLHFTNLQRNATISQHIYPSLKSLIDKKNRKISKLGGEALTLTKGNTYYKNVFSKDGVKYCLPVCDVTVSGQYPHLGDWLIGVKIDHVALGEDTNLVHCMFPEMEAHAKDEQHADSFCQHCNTRRRRNVTFLLKNMKNQEVMKVGSSCLKDFIPGDVSLYRYTAEAVVDIMESFADDDFSVDEMPKGALAYNLEGFLAMVVLDAERYGWHPRNKSGIGELGSADEALEAYGKGLADPDKHPDEFAKAKAMILFAKSELAPTSSFEMNLVNIVKSGVVTLKTFGIAAALYPLYLRQKDKLSGSTGDFVGTLKERITSTLVYQSRKEKSSGYGDIYYIYAFSDNNGNSLRWTSSKDMQFKMDESYNLTFTIKKHSEYNGKRYTFITRAKLAP